jgi:hypothetical protein
LLDRHGRSYCEELGIRLETNTPSALFRWLCAALLFSARISAGLAHRAAKARTEQGWATPHKMAQTSWSKRSRMLNRARYARYNERTATTLGSTVEKRLRVPRLLAALTRTGLAKDYKAVLEKAASSG